MPVCRSLVTSKAGFGTATVSDFIFGVASVLAFCVLIFAHKWNQHAVAKGRYDNAHALVLPAYFNVIYYLAFMFIVAAVLNLTTTHGDLHPAILAINYGLIQVAITGVAFFLMRHGAGQRSFTQAFKYSLLWGIIAGVWMYFIHQHMEGDRLGFMDSSSTQTGLLLYVGLKGVMIVFCLVVRFVPPERLYRRPALHDYVAFFAMCETCHVVAAVLLHFEFDVGFCIEGAAMFFISGIMEPAIIFHTLCEDSQYWQGRYKGGSTQAMTAPFRDILEDISSETVNALATCVQDLETQPIPLLHFGLIDMEQSLGYAAGGFSRVYFGKMNGQRVALKLLFTLDLTPQTIAEFCEEATILHSLAHDNIVQCHGVCILPPALCLVQEYCHHGSLYSVLHEFKVMFDPEQNSRQISRSLLMSVMGGLRNLWSDSGSGIDSRTLGRSVMVSARYPKLFQADSTDKQRQDFFSVGHRPKKVVESETPSKMLRHSDPNVPVSGKSWSGSFNSQPKMSMASFDGNNPANDPDFSYKRVGKSRFSVFGIESSERETFTVTTRQTEVRNIPLRVRLRMMRDCARGVAFLHSKGLMHCDIKSLNFLVNKDFDVKLADLGECRPYPPNPAFQRPLPTPVRNWAPPESISRYAGGVEYSPASDVYALAMCFWELFTCDVPYDEDVFQTMQHDDFVKLVCEGGARPDIPPDMPAYLSELLDRCWKKDPAERPDMQEVLTVIEARASSLV